MHSTFDANVACLSKTESIDTALLLSALGQDLLDRLLLLQQKGTNDPLPDAGVAGGAPVAPGHGPLPLDGAAPLRVSQVLDPLQRRLAVAAPRPFRCLLQPLRLEDSTGGADRAVPVLLGIVGVASSLTKPAIIRHCCFKSDGRYNFRGQDSVSMS